MNSAQLGEGEGSDDTEDALARHKGRVNRAHLFLAGKKGNGGRARGNS